jgi:mannose-6-phosphate isomerase-like protein (cupin superfamily)
LFDAGSGDVGVWGGTEPPFEATNKMGNSPVKSLCRFCQRDLVGDIPIEKRAELVCESRFRLGDRGIVRFQVSAETFRDHGKPGFDVDRIRSDQSPVKKSDGGSERTIMECRGVYGPADQLHREKVAVEVQVALAEPAEALGGVAVVDHAGWEEGDGLAYGTVMAGVQVVANRTVVDDEDCPVVVAVRWIAVVDDVGVKHLGDTWHGRLPCHDLTGVGNLLAHVKIVQDPVSVPDRQSPNMEPKPLNLTEALASFDDVYSPRIVARMNDYDVRIAHTKGEHVWHVHADTDEFFLVLDGRFDIAVRDADGRETTVVLGKGDTFVVPKGTEHKPSSPGGSILMFEPAGTSTTGDRNEGDIPDHVDSTTGHALT